MLSKIKIANFPSLYPPRPSGAIHPSSLALYPGYIAQYKYDDIRILIYFYPDGQVQLLSRKREPLLSYSLDAAMVTSLRSLALASGKHHLLDGGLMRHGSLGTERRPIVLWDILIHEDRYLLGTRYSERYRLLKKICGTPKIREKESGEKIGLRVAPGLWLAPVFKQKFDERFHQARNSKNLEGLVLKNPQGRLDWGTREENNGQWQIRVRKPNGRHVF